MKKILLSIVALGTTVAVSAQSSQALGANAVLVSQTRDGNVVTSRYKIPHNTGRHAEFDLRYAINKAVVAPTYSNNSQQIAELKDFMAQSKDTTLHISAIHIVGYASPDGDAKQNNSLASKRAQSLYQYAVNTYHPTQNIDTAYKTFKWSDCVPAVEKSSIPQKEQVLAVLNSTQHTEPQKEAALRKMPDAWNYLTTKILPDMRYADIEFDYGVDEFVTRTTTVAETESPKPTEPTAQQPCPNEVVVVDEEVGIIVATPNLDDKEPKRHKRNSKKSDKKESQAVYEVVYW